MRFLDAAFLVGAFLAGDAGAGAGAASAAAASSFASAASPSASSDFLAYLARLGLGVLLPCANSALIWSCSSVLSASRPEMEAAESTVRRERGALRDL